MRLQPLYTIFSITLLALLCGSTCFCSQSWAVSVGQENQIITPSGGTESATFGQTSLSGDTVIFGSMWQEYTEDIDSGAVYIYGKDATLGWRPSGILGPSGSDRGGIHYGEACAIDGDTIAVGAPYYRSEGEPFGEGETLGAVYIYDRAENDAWNEVAMFTCPTGAAETLFGGHLALDGDNLIVGAVSATATVDENIYDGGGQAFVFNRNQGGNDNWGLVSTLTGSETMIDNAKFGQGVDIEGNLITVGAYRDSVATTFNAGQAYVFEFDGSDWNEVKTIKDNIRANAKQGITTAIDGDYVVVGANGDSSHGVDTGAAFVYARDEGGEDTWGQVGNKLIASDAASGDLFGFDCAFDNGKIAIGAYRSNVSETDQGTVYYFEQDEFGAWVEKYKFIASDASDSDMLGYSVDLQGDQLFATALRGDSAVKDTGEAYFFDLSAFIEASKVPGDANGDGNVDGSDIAILAGNWQAGVPDGDPENVAWGMGDFNGDGQVDGSDIAILAGNWQYGNNSNNIADNATSPVPEPSTILLLLTAIVSIALIRRR